MNVYSYQEARDASVDYFSGDELAADVFVGKYALQDLQGRIYESTPAMMHRRLAREFARIEARYPNAMSEDEIFDLFTQWDVIPQGGPMSAIGNPHQVQSLSNCFVIDSPYDSYAGIMRTDQEQVQIMKRRGGVGFDISPIRPKAMPTANAARTSDGITIFMDRYSNSCREVAQGGRRGALMLTISVHHPDVLDFANVKRDRRRVTGANVSVRVTNEFMRAVEAGTTYQQRFPVEADAHHQIVRDVDAREVWHGIMSAMRDCSEPGLLFWDTVQERSPADAYHAQGFSSSSTNPCGEIVLSPNDSCRLLLVNFSRFVIDPFTPSARFDHERFASVVQKAQRLMDDMIDLEVEAIDRIISKIDSDPEPADVKRTEASLWKKIRAVALKGRRTGLGGTALGDTFAYMGHGYGSDESIALTDSIYRALALNAYRSSVAMAEERGPFEAYDYVVESNHPFIQQIMELDDALAVRYRAHGRRNIACTTTAPAGSTSIMSQTTSGCEPVLFIKARRKRKVTASDKQAQVHEVDALGDAWQYYDTYHHGVTSWMKITGQTDVSLSPYHGSTVEQIDHKRKVDVQAAAQRWICHSISNTTNLPTTITVDDVSELCMHAWRTGCKGITVYRIGSRDAVIVKDDGNGNGSKPQGAALDVHAPKRPRELPCDVHHVSIKGEQYLVLVGIMDGRPYEVFAGLSMHVDVPRKVKKGTLIRNGRKDGLTTYNLSIPVGEDDQILLKDVVALFDNPEHGALTRMISLSMRHGVPTQFLTEQLKKDKHSDLQSFSSVVARVLKGYIKDGTTVTAEKTCPDCSSTKLQYQQGCVSCECGWSKC